MAPLAQDIPVFAAVASPLYWPANPSQLGLEESIRQRAVFPAVVVAALAGASWMAVRPWNETGLLSIAEARSRLAESARELRPTEGRLSLDLGYSVFEPSRRTALPDDRQPLRNAMRKAWAASNRSSAEALGLQGVLYLMSGDVDSAVRRLERATDLRPKDAVLQSDLAAAYLAQARQEQNARDLVLAYQAADRAVSADPALIEARFNRALALDTLLLTGRALIAWQEVLDREPASSGWAQEAAARLASLRQPPGGSWSEVEPRLGEAARAGDRKTVETLVDRFPQEARLYVEDELLSLWGEAVQKGDEADAERALAAARDIAEVLAARGEWMPADAVAAIDAAEGNGRDALTEGHAEYRHARRLYSDRSGDAGALFAKAQRAFEQGASPMAAWASLYQAIGIFESFDFAAARAELVRLLEKEKTRNTRYPGLVGRAHWMLGLILLAHGDPAASIQAYRTALGLFEKIGAHEGAVGVYIGLIESSHHLGDQRMTWRHLYEGLALAREVDSPRRRHGLLTEGAEACLDWGPRDAALLFRDEVVRVARTEEPAGLSHALLQRNDTLRLLGDLEGARLGLAEARRQLTQISNGDLRRRVEADLLMAEGELALAFGDPKGAVEKLTRAFTFHGGRGNQSLSGYLSLARARAALAEGDLAQAEADLRRGIEESERQREGVPDEELKISFFERSRALFDELVEIQTADRRRIEEAFDTVEQGRARALLDHLQGSQGSQKTSTAREVLAELLKDIAIVEYAVLPDRLLAWVLQDGRIELVQEEISEADLEKQVVRLRSALRLDLPEEKIRAAAAPLHDRLIRPLQPFLRPGETLVIVPDRVLNEIPFAILFDRLSGRYLVQDRATVLAPSASLFVWAQKRGRSLGASPGESVLAVGNPAFRQEDHFGLRPLPEAEREAAAVGSLFPHSRVLTGPAATRKSFLVAVAEHDVVHFAGHAQINRKYPHLSHLVLAPENDRDAGLLYAHEIQKLLLPRTRLAVLAACDGAGGTVGGEGLIGLARAWFAAGVPTVAATYWSVEDQPAARFFLSFHQNLRQGGDAAAALRQAQLALLGDSDPEMRAPRAWGGFVLFGSPGNYSPRL
jgi:CHAT domain-containing protein